MPGLIVCDASEEPPTPDASLLYDAQYQPAPPPEPGMIPVPPPPPPAITK